MLASAAANGRGLRFEIMTPGRIVFVALSVVIAARSFSAAASDAPELGRSWSRRREVQAPAFDVPAAISSVRAEQLRKDALGINLADDIGTVPGLLARNRNNYAQDQQISIRGIGANSTFGIRGVRVYQDGIPATGPDGQGQVSQFNLDSAQRVEVLRGPFSALYGNSSGGVIQIFTADGQAGEVRSGVTSTAVSVHSAPAWTPVDAAGPLGYNLDFTHFYVDGYRPHSSARNESFNGKVDYTLRRRAAS